MHENFVQEMCERTRIGKNDKFVDVGSGIGQVIIQIAATIGCSCVGYEYIEQRHNHAVLLKTTFINILREAGVTGVDYLDSLIDLQQADFRDYENSIGNASVIFFNNYGPFFDSQTPMSINHQFSNLVGFMNPGTRIVTLKVLMEVAKRVDCKKVLSMKC